METLKEMIEGYGELYGHYSTDRMILFRNTEKCVIAYYINVLGICFIIKGSKRYFAFKGRTNRSGDYFVSRINLQEAIKLIENPREKRVMLKSRIDKMKDTFIFEELEK